MELAAPVLIATAVISVVFAFLALCTAIFAVIKVISWEKREVQVIPFGAMQSQNPATSGLEKLQKQLDEIMPSEDELEQDFNNIGVSVNPKTNSREEELV